MSVAHRIEQVKAAHRRGWSFTPLRGKRPYLDEWTTLPRESEAQAIRWAEIGNIGLRCGRVSGVLVLDVDLLELPPELATLVTPTVLTGSGKYHLYCLMPDRPVGSPALYLPDCRRVGELRGNGGQVVFVGSTHPETRESYDWASGRSPQHVALADAPSWVFERPQPKSRRVVRLRDGGSLADAAGRFTAKVSGRDAGARHSTAVALVAHLHGFSETRSNAHLTNAQISALAHEWNFRNTPPLPISEVERILAWFVNGGSGKSGPVHLVRDAADVTRRAQQIREERRLRMRRIAKSIEAGLA